MSPTRSILAASAAVFLAAGLAGCSSSENAAALSAHETRDVRLVESSAPETAQISALEAGRALTAPPAVKAHRHEAAATAAELVADAAISMERTPILRSTAGLPTELVAAPEPMAPADQPVVIVGTGVQPEYASYGGYGTGSAAGRGGPGVIIRGGRGGVDDDCDLDRPGHRGPIAINRVAPAPGGGGSIGIRPRGMSFPRGIR